MFAFSNWKVKEQSFGDIKLDLFVISNLKPRDSKSSSTPVVTFFFHSSCSIHAEFSQTGKDSGSRTQAIKA